MYSRRDFLSSLSGSAAGLLALGTVGSEALAEALDEVERYDGDPEPSARDESFWFAVQQAFPVDRTVINFNNGGVSPTPVQVMNAIKRRLDHANTTPHATLNGFKNDRNRIRRDLARLFGCDGEEIALVRNTSMGMEICQFGFDLKKGDEVLTTDQDYSRMIRTWQQRERRDGIALKMIEIPTPAEDEDEIVDLFARNITRKTKIIMICHVINLTGQIMPVGRLCQLGREKGIPVIVDGAHSFGLFDFSRDQLDCDYFATSLHKWLCGPPGTGFLYVRKDRIEDLWPLMSDNGLGAANIRKFEEIGTHCTPLYSSIAEAITFHENIGVSRKIARMRYLRDRWVKPLLQYDKVRLHSSLKPEFSCGFANVEIEGVNAGQLARHLSSKHRISTVSIKHKEQFEGIRVTPNIYTTLDEIDRFTEAMVDVVENGLPG